MGNRGALEETVPVLPFCFPIKKKKRNKTLSCLCPVFCRVYMPDHSYVTIRSRLSASVQDILGSVTEKLQYSEEPAEREDSLILVAVASSGGEGQEELGWGPGEKLTSLVPWGGAKTEF